MKLFTKLFLTFALLCFAGVYSAFAGTEVTLTPADLEAVTEQAFSGSKGDVSISCTTGTVTEDQIRVFKNQTITFSSTKDIEKIVFTCTAKGTAKYGPGCFNAQDGYTFDAEGPTGTWEGTATSVAFTAETNQVRLTQVVITLADDEPGPVEPALADGTYYIKNVASGNFFTGANSWGTQASVAPSGAPFEVAILPEGGGYSLKYPLSTVGNKFLGSNLYVDSTTPDGGFAIEKNEDNTYVIKLAGKYIAEGTEKGSTNDAIAIQTDELTDAAKWQFLTFEEAVAAMKSGTNVGATFMISNPNFNRNTSTAAWTVSADCTNKNLGGGDNNNFCAESYHSPFTISQVLANVPAGKYQMTAQGFYRQDGDVVEDAPVFFANDKTAAVPAKTGSENSMNDASASFSAGQYTIEPIEFTIFEDGQLTIGIKNSNASQWVIWDNFQLTYLTSEIPASEFEPAYNEALAAAQAALDNEDYAAVTGAERTALAKAIADYTTIEEPTVELYKAAIAALTAATNAFTGAKGAYTALANAKAEMAEVSYPYAAAAKKSAAEAALNATAASAEDATAKIAAIETAFRQYAESSALLEGTFGAVNVTDSIVNPNAQEDIAEPWIVVKGEGSGGSLKVLDGEPLTDGEGNSAYKYFDGGDWGANAWDVALEQTIDLPAGKYYLTAAGRASADVELTLFAGENTAKIAAVGAQGALFGRGWSDASVEFEMAEAGDITIGVRGVTSVVRNWMSFTRFRLVKFGEPGEDAAEIAVPEGMENLIENGNLAGESVVSFVAKEAPASAPSPAKIVAMAGKDLSRGIVVKSADNPSQAWDTQFWINLKQELPVGAKLHVEFDYAANKTAKVTTQTHAAPGSYKGGFGPEMSFTTEWKNFSLDYEVTAAGIQSIAFNLAEEKTATEYYFDNFGVWAEMPAEVTWKDIIVNGDMEGDDPTCFFVTEQGVGGPFVATITDGIGKDNSKAVKVQSADSPAQDWDTQFFIRLPYQLPAGTRYKLSFDYKADKAGDFDTQAHAEPGQYIHYTLAGSGSFAEEWKTYTTEGAVPTECNGNDNNGGYKNIFQTIAFNLAKNKVATEFIFDNVKFEVDETIIETLVKNPYCAADAKLAEAPEGWTNLITNGNLANEDVTSFVAKEAPSSDIVGARIVAGAGKDYSHGIQVVAPAKVKDAWESQFWIKVSEPLVEGTKLHVEFDYKADKAASAETQAHAAPGGYQHWAAIGTVNFTTEWQHYSADVDITAAMAKGNDGNGTGTGVLSIAFNLSQAEKDVVYSFDNFGVWSQVPVVNGINTAKTDKNAEGVYNLNGQKVMKAQKGLYIINGKKVVK